MAKFVFAYRGGGVPQTEAEQKAVMDAWMGWFGAMGAAVVDGGNPFGASTTVRAPGAKGAGAGSGLSGYSVVQAATLQDAAALAAGCPILTSGGEVDVFEALDM